MAEGVFKHIASSPPTSSLISKIDSAGTGSYHIGDSPDRRTISTLRKHGITDYKHAARVVTREDFRNFDYILAMDEYNLRDLLHLRNNVANKTSIGSRRYETRKADQEGAADSDSGAKLAEVRLFGNFRPDGTVEAEVGGGEVIEDPYYGGVNGFEEAYEQAARFSKGFLEYLKGKIIQPES